MSYLWEKDKIKTKRRRREGRKNNGKGKEERKEGRKKGRKEASQRMLNKIKASQLSDTEFKALVIRKLNELTENY